MKTCKRCKETKDLSNFSKCSTTKDGLYAWCKACAKEYRHNYYFKDHEASLEKVRNWRNHNKDKAKICYERWRKLNYEYVKKQKSDKRKSNRPKENQYKRAYYKRMYKNPLFRLHERLRKTLRASVSRIKIQSYTKDCVKLLGCTLEFFKEHLEKQFKDDMTWDNYGKWHIDHKKPIASFDFTKDDDIKACFHYSNLQPLWAIDNMRKGSKLLYV